MSSTAPMTAREVLDRALEEQGRTRAGRMSTDLAIAGWLATEYTGASVRDLEELTGHSKSAWSRAIAEHRGRMRAEAAYRAMALRLDERIAEAFPMEDEDDPGERF